MRLESGGLSPPLGYTGVVSTHLCAKTENTEYIDGVRDCPNSLISIKIVSQAPNERI
jgi:hypothetical protein